MNDSLLTPKARSKYQIKRQSLPEVLADSLRERILNGEFKEGEPLVQEAIALEYECSRMPVREAFRQLEAAGLIISKIHKGSVVTALPTEQIYELFELRALLECSVLAHSLPRMTERSLANSEQILSQLEDAYNQRDIAKVGALNWDFHRSLYVPADRVQSLSIIQGINVQTDRYIRLQLLLTSAFKEAAEDHRKILTMCQDRDDKVIEFMRSHIIRAGQNLIAALNSRKGNPA